VGQLIRNAKKYNAPKSQAFQDAEVRPKPTLRLQKLVSMENRYDES
jgi:hypothetical protein